MYTSLRAVYFPIYEGIYMHVRGRGKNLAFGLYDYHSLQIISLFSLVA